MHIEAVCVCVDYSDFLAVALPTWMPHFERVLVVTTPEDRRTQAVCEWYRAEWMTSTAMRAGSRRFSLGAGLNRGVRRLDRESWACAIDADLWACVIDADLVLPDHTCEVLEAANLDPECIHGIDRMSADRDAWEVIRDHSQWQDPAIVDPPPLRLGSRVAIPAAGGYVPCGYFQLWNPDASGVYDYPVHPAGTAEGSDILHALRWSRERRVLIPEVIGIHLETSSVRGANWGGRISPEFP